MDDGTIPRAAVAEPENLSLGAIGNCSVSALVDARARVVWYCTPRFDSDPAFQSLLCGPQDRERAAYMAVELEGFVRTLARNDHTVRQFNQTLAQVSGMLKGERGDLADSLHNLAIAMKQVSGFVRDNREILGKNRNANIFRMMAHSPSYFEQYCRLGGAIRHRGELDPIVRELAITRTGILCEAPYEIVAHQRIGKNVGVSDEQNAALENWEAATCFNEVQRAALAFTDEIVRLRRPSDATFNAIAAKLTPAALVEFIRSTGHEPLLVDLEAGL